MAAFRIIPSISTVLFCGLLFIICHYAWSLFFKRSKNGARLPPGPRPWPLIGNLLDMPPPHVRATTFWSEHGAKYGPISSLQIFGNTFIVLNDAKIADDLLNKRPTVYSGRPRFTFVAEIMGFAGGWMTLQHGDRHRAYRRYAHNAIGTVGFVQRWAEPIDIETRRYLLRVLQSPKDFLKHISYQNATVAARALYGYTCNPAGKDALVDAIFETNEYFNAGTMPGRWLVDTMPALKHVPDWFPGASFKRIGRAWKKTVDKTTNVPYAFAKKQVEQGVAKPSVVSIGFAKSERPLTEDDEWNLKWAALSLFIGASDTTFTMLEITHLDMALFPDAQKKAQAEIDAVVGTDRLPDPSDRKNLPYVEAYFKEIVRWEVIGAISVPLAAVQDDYYEGYWIPKGAIFMTHVAGMYHDPARHKDPFAFNPERFLGPNPEPSPFELSWGFGRRVCPGRYLADANIWMMIVRTLAVFNVSAIKGQEPKTEFEPGFISHPKPFKVDIKIRSAKHEALVRAVEVEHPLKEGDGHLLKW